MPAGGIYKAAPISPNAPKVEIIHPPFFSGAVKTAIRVFGTFPDNTPVGCNFSDLYIQQFGDSKIYRIDVTNPVLVNLASDINGLNAKRPSPSGAYIASAVEQTETSFTNISFCCVHLGTAPFSSTILLDSALQVFDITDLALANVITSTSYEFPNTLDILSVWPDDTGAIYFVTQEFDPITSDRLYRMYSLAPHGSVPTLLASYDSDSGSTGTVSPFLTIWDGPGSEIDSIGVSTDLITTYALIAILGTDLSFLLQENIQSPAVTTVAICNQNKAGKAAVIPSLPVGGSPPNVRPILYSKVGSSGPILRSQIVGLTSYGSSPSFLRVPYGELTAATSIPFTDAFWSVYIGKKKHAAIDFDLNTDGKPRIYLLTGSLGGTLTKGAALAGFSPGMPDPTILRILDPADLSCENACWWYTDS
jgi:hypothetical protein